MIFTLPNFEYLLSISSMIIFRIPRMLPSTNVLWEIDLKALNDVLNIKYFLIIYRIKFIWRRKF